MIRVWTPPETWALRQHRVRKLQVLRVEQAQAESFYTGHLAFRDRLVRAQHFKCCWCDQRPTRRATVEHFRPKVRATGAGQGGAGYGWLAWSPSNLLYACGECNTPKGTDFPLETGSTRLAFGAQPPGGERAVFVDPGREDPAEHICFFPDRDPDDLDARWRPTARDGCVRGEETLKALGLDDDIGYFSNLDQHVDETVIPAVQRLKDADIEQFAQYWDSEVTLLLAPESELALLSHDVLAHHFAERIQAGEVVLPRPWNATPTAFDLADETDALRAAVARIAALPPLVADRLARCHDKAPVSQKRALLADLATHIPLTSDELALLMGGQAETWTRHARAAGLTLDDRGWTRA